MTMSSPMMSPPAAPAGPPRVDDAIAMRVVSLWQQMFPDAALLPVIGLPSNGKGCMTMTHTMGRGAPPMSIDGLPSRSPLANNALYSCEVSGGRYLNLYEVMLPDVPGSGGRPSSVQRYVNAVSRLGIDVAGYHFHWSGARSMGYFPLAIHTQNAGMDPFEFARRTFAGFRAALGPG